MNSLIIVVPLKSWLPRQNGSDCSFDFYNNCNNSRRRIVKAQSRKLVPFSRRRFNRSWRRQSTAADRVIISKPWARESKQTGTKLAHATLFYDICTHKTSCWRSSSTHFPPPTIYTKRKKISRVLLINQENRKEKKKSFPIASKSCTLQKFERQQLRNCLIVNSRSTFIFEKENEFETAISTVTDLPVENCKNGFPAQTSLTVWLLYLITTTSYAEHFSCVKTKFHSTHWITQALVLRMLIGQVFDPHQLPIISRDYSSTN